MRLMKLEKQNLIVSVLEVVVLSTGVCESFVLHNVNNLNTALLTGRGSVLEIYVNEELLITERERPEVDVNHKADNLDVVSSM